MGKHGLMCANKGGITVVPNDNNELTLMQLIMGKHVSMDYRKLNSLIEKDHFLMSFMDQMLDQLYGRGWYCFLNG